MVMLSTGGYTSGGGMLGTGGGVSGKKKTAAGTPSGWYNVQEFLGANQQDPAIRQRIEERGQEQLGGAVEQYGKDVEALQDIPEASQFDQGRFQGYLDGGLSEDEKSTIQQGLGQTFEGFEPGTQSYELAPELQLPERQSPFSGLKEGDMSSMMGWFGEAERPSATYTPGMQKMDEMLLRGQKGFTEDYPKQLKEQYQKQVTDPMMAKREAIGNAQDIARGGEEQAGSFEAAKQDWRTGIGSFLRGQQKRVDTRLVEQQAKQAEVANQPAYELMGQDYSNALQFSPTGGQIDGRPSITQTDLYGIQGLTPSDYLSYRTPTPADLGTAASAELTPEEIETYNFLQQAQTGGTEGLYSGGQTFDPGGWSYNKDRFVQDYRDRARQVAEAQALTQIGALGQLPGQEIQLQPGYEFDPGQAMAGVGPYAEATGGMTSYTAPTQTMTPYGMVDLSYQQGGEQFFSPWTTAYTPQKASDNAGGG